MSGLYLQAEKDQQDFELSGEVTVGRQEGCDLILTEGHPSRKHARLWVQDGVAWIEDLGSANGTFVNENPISAPQALKVGDRIRFDVAAYCLMGPEELSDATIVRPMDPSATVIRPIPTEPPPVVPEVAPEPPAEAPPEAAPAPVAETPAAAPVEAAPTPAPEVAPEPSPEAPAEVVQEAAEEPAEAAPAPEPEVAPGPPPAAPVEAPPAPVTPAEAAPTPEPEAAPEPPPAAPVEAPPTPVTPAEAAPTPEPEAPPAPVPEAPPAPVPEVAAEAPAEAPAEAAPAPVAPSSEAPKSDSGAPGSWQNQGGATVALTADQMAEIRSQIPQAEVVATDRPQLHVRSGTRKGEIIDLDGDPREWLIGSDQQKADICFPDQNVSAEQAVLSVANQRWKISDLISKNKTFVNGQNTPISYLQSGDVIAFGTVQFAIALPEGRPRKSSASRGKQKTAAPKKISTWLIVGIAAAVTVGLLVVALQFL